MIKLHYHPISTYSHRVLIAAAEKGIELDLSVVDVLNKQQKTEEYQQINPYCRIPAIEDGNFVLYESTTILQYLEEKYPNNPLMPESVQERALTNMHIRLCDQEFTNHVIYILKQIAFLPKDQWDLSGIKQAKELINSHLDKLSKEVDSQEFIVGNQFTLADICYATFVPYLKVMGITAPDELAPWIKNITGRESVKSVLPPNVK